MAADAARRRAVLAALSGALRGTLGGTLTGAMSGRAAAAADEHAFPRRAVRLVVPYSVGIGPDVVARSVADGLAQRWGQPVLVDNKPGASGIVAFGEVRRTAADGHTLFVADTATLAVNPLIHATLPYDPVRDLEPLTLLFHATFLLWVGSTNRLRSVRELLEAARAQPQRISYASLGNGHASHVAIESFARAADVQMLHVPFKDLGSLLSAVVSGDVDFTVMSMNTMAPLLARGHLRPLAVAAKSRLASHPEIPTLVEAGGPPVQMHPWAALVARAGTPAPLLAQLQSDIAAVLASAEVRRRAETAGFEITPSTPQALRARIDADIALYRPLVAEGRVARN
jgi:tripartite-type tricarboxylate transporter receptor subunit TctC